jgi:hypothetical protein
MEQDQKTFMNLVLNNGDANLMVVDFEDLAKRQAVRLAARDIAQPLKSQPARVEYNQLRKELFASQEFAKNAEIYANGCACTVKLLEQRITELLKQKKAAVDSPLAERNFENQIQLLETELLDAKTEFNRARHQSNNAGRGLKAFGGHERIAELKAELGIA